MQRIEALALPPNFLDTLIEKLGGPKAVAEMTGRKGRVVRDNKGHGMYELRAKPDSSEMDSLNVREAGGRYLTDAACISSQITMGMAPISAIPKMKEGKPVGHSQCHCTQGI